MTPSVSTACIAHGASFVSARDQSHPGSPPSPLLCLSVYEIITRIKQSGGREPGDEAAGRCKINPAKVTRKVSNLH